MRHTRFNRVVGAIFVCRGEAFARKCHAIIDKTHTNASPFRLFNSPSSPNQIFREVGSRHYQLEGQILPANALTVQPQRRYSRHYRLE